MVAKLCRMHSVRIENGVHIHVCYSIQAYMVYYRLIYKLTSTNKRQMTVEQCRIFTGIGREAESNPGTLK